MPILTGAKHLRKRRDLLSKEPKLWNVNRGLTNPGVSQATAFCLHQLFDMQVERTPKATAIRSQAETIDFKTLNQRANQVAHYLRANGVGSESIVGIYMDRSIQMVVNALGVLKAGAAYLPCDPHYPKDRLVYMLNHSRASWLLTLEKFAANLPRFQGRLCVVDGEPGVFHSPHIHNPTHDCLPENTAYVIYTSGSTGNPKGVMGLHGGMINRLQWQWRTYPFQSGDVCCQKAPFSFVDAVGEVFAPLLQGVPLIIIPEDVVRDPSQLIQTLREEKVTRINLVASLLRLIIHASKDLSQDLPGLRFWVNTGEELPPDLQESFFRAYPEATLINLYGPTEASIEVSCWECRSGPEQSRLPIGRPIENMQLYVLDDQLRELPENQEGELFYSGPGLARGYLHDPAQTAKKFLPNPYVNHGQSIGGRLYQSGDFAKKSSDGVFTYLGRRDSQVKIRGQRIELKEIEGALHGMPNIKESAVVVVELPGGLKRLVAYVAPLGKAGLDKRKLKYLLRQRLPAAMIPAQIFILDNLPRTPSGKINRAVLREANHSCQNPETYVAPQEKLAKRLAQIWREALALPRIGMEDNFFELGGDSFSAAKATYRMGDLLGIPFNVNQLFDTPTLQTFMASLPAALGEGARPQKPNPSGGSGEVFEGLSLEEQRLWLLDKIEDSGAAYTLHTAFRLHGPLDEATLRGALIAIMQRHEILRTRFPEIDGQPRREILPQEEAESALDLTRIDVSQFPRSERWKQALSQATRLLGQKFDLARGPLHRTCLIRLGANDHLLIFAFHHIISDDRSIDIFIGELSAFYNEQGSGPSARCPKLPGQYADYAARRQKAFDVDRLELQSRYWKQRLAGSPQILNLPRDRPRPIRQRFRGKHLRFTLSEGVSRSLKELTLDSGHTPFMVLLGAYAILLHRCTQEKDVLIGTPCSMRTDAQTEHLMGFFVNTLVMRSTIREDLSAWEFLLQIRKTVLEAREHQDLPFHKLVELFRNKSNPGVNPIFQTMFIWQRTPVRSPLLNHLESQRVFLENHCSIVDLSLTIGDTGDFLYGELEYNSDLFNEERMIRLSDQFQTLLTDLISHPGKKLSTLQLASPDDWSYFPSAQHLRANPVGEKKPLLVHQLFALQVARTPDAIAVIDSGCQMTYQDLDRRSDQLAHELRTAGVTLEQPVGLSTRRSVDMIIGVLGILKTGAAMVALDPNYPQPRRAAMMEDSNVGCVVVDQPNAPMWSGYPGLKLMPLQKNAASSLQTTSQANPRMHQQNLAYVVYTSGSSGKPKGIMISHQAIADHCLAMIDHYGLSDHDRVLQFASLSFDPAMEQMFCSLLTGACLVLRPDEVWTLSQFQTRMAAYQVSVVNIPPAYWLQWAEEWSLNQDRTGAHDSLRLVIVGGDQFPASALRQWRNLPTENIRLLNAYGPSETTVTCMTHAVVPNDSSAHPASAAVPLGKPVPNRVIYLCDPSLELMSRGLEGEITIAGSSLARGYLNLPGLTASTFVPDPHRGVAGARCFRSGDRGEHMPDGTVCFLGRRDNQIKMDGFRLEPGDIESAIKRHDGVLDAVVTKAASSATRLAPPPQILEAALAAIDPEQRETLLAKIEALGPNEVRAELDRITLDAAKPGPSTDEVLRRKTSAFELALRITDPKYIQPPRAWQRNWILQRAMDEFADDIRHLDRLSKGFVKSRERAPIRGDWETSEAGYDPSNLVIDGQAVMQSWQRPLMKAMADIVAESKGDILEVGFGMGLSSSFIQEHRVASHTLIECNQDVIGRFEKWRKGYPQGRIHLIKGMWQEVVDQLDLYDGILFDTYPVSEKEFNQSVLETITFAQPFFETAAMKLKQGGVFTYYTNEIDSFSRRHQRLLLRHFSSFTISVAKPLSPPDDNVNWWADSMVVVKAQK